MEIERERLAYRGTLARGSDLLLPKPLRSENANAGLPAGRHRPPESPKPQPWKVTEYRWGKVTMSIYLSNDLLK